MDTKRFLLAVLLTLLTACATIPGQAVWPAEMPPRSYFQDYYRQDPIHMTVSTEQQYIKWIKNFYLGSFYYRKGWLEVTEEMLATLSYDANKKLAKQLLFSIGKKASSEWAKDRNHRLINLRHVIIWGNAMNESIVRKQQIATLNKIHDDIDSLLIKELGASDINAERYFISDVVEDDGLFL